MKSMSRARRPYVICHMTPSVDGRIVVKDWKLPKSTFAEYERTAKTFGANAWMIGRISMEPYAGKAELPTAAGLRLPRTDYVARAGARSYAIALDPSGKLRWKSGAIDGEPVISILTEQVSDQYLAFLHERGISYVFGGKKRVDLRRVLEKLRSAFGIDRLLLEGGGKINGAFLAAGLIDELSLLIAPIADGSLGTATLFDIEGKRVPPHLLELLSVEKCRGDLVWLRYRIKAT